MVKILVSGGANVDNRNYIGLTEYELANLLGFTEINEYLLEQHTFNRFDAVLNKIAVLRNGSIHLSRRLQLLLSENQLSDKFNKNILRRLVEFYYGKDAI